MIMRFGESTLDITLEPDIRVEIHRGCGGEVRLAHEGYRCARCGTICSIYVTRLILADHAAPSRTTHEIQTELRRVNDAIDALYWAFTRQARAKPPAATAGGPALYARRRELEAELGSRP